MKIIIFYLLVFASQIGLAQTANPWRKLFNEKDLTGWKILNGKAQYEVKDAMIVGTTVINEPNSFLATEEMFGDFILELEFKIEEGTNSGPTS